MFGSRCILWVSGPCQEIEEGKALRKITGVLCVLSVVFLLSACGRMEETTWQEQYDLGVRYLSEGNYEEAIIAFTAAIEIDPKASDAYLMLAEVYLSQDDTEQAVQVLYSGWQNCPEKRQTFLEELDQLGYFIDKNGELNSLQSLEDDAFYAYQEILDKIYYGILNQWQDINFESALSSEHDISCLWYFPYTSVHSLADGGYMLVDLNEDGVSELIISPISAASVSDQYNTGMIYDLYTYQNGQVLHLATSAERDRYNLCDNQIVANEGSSGAADSSFRYYEIEKNTGALTLKEQVRYYGMDNPDNPWFYETTDTYDPSEMIQVSETEAANVINQYTYLPLDLTLFEGYAPRSANEKPADGQSASGVDHSPIDYVGITVNDLISRCGPDFVYGNGWMAGSAKPIYYADFRVPLIFYYLDPEHRSNVNNDESVIIVEYLPSEDEIFSEIAPGIATNMTYSDLLNAGYEGTFYHEGGEWMRHLGETSQFSMQFNSTIWMTFYWFDHTDPYSTPAERVQLYIV